MSSAEDLLARGYVRAAERMLLDLTRRPETAGHAFVQLARIALHDPRGGSARAAWRRVERARAAGLDTAGLHQVAGECRARLGALDDAIIHLRMAVARDPGAPQLWSDLGNLLRRQGDHAESLVAHRHAVSLGPDRATLWSNYGTALGDAGRPRQALEAFGRAVALRPDHPNLRHNLGNAQLRAAQDDDELGAAVETLRDALALEPTFVAARVDLATALRQLGAHEEAFDQLQLAVRLDPSHVEARYNLALACLGRGHRGGFAHYEARRELPGFPVRRPAVDDWSGVPHPAGHLWISHEQGLGDAMQFSRFVVPAAGRFAGRVTWTMPARLGPVFAPLVQRASNLEIVLDDPQRRAVVSEATHHVPLMSLPLRLGHDRIEDLPPCDGAYLQPDPIRSQRWSSWLDECAGPGTLRVGIAWQGNPRYAGDRHRSVPLRQFAPIAALPGVRLFALQRGFGEEQMAERNAPAVRRLSDDADRDGAFVDTIALTAALDLVISTDTAVLHVAAAAGATVFVPLAQRCDWRWGANRSRTSWYRGVHLFRQTRHGDWEEVFERIKVAVQRSHSCKYGSTLAQAS